MFITRKQALVALVAGLVPWMTRRANAEVAGGQTDRAPLLPAPPASSTQKQIDDLTRRIATLEAQLANQVAFTKDASGNLTLSAPANVKVSSGATLELKSAGETNLAAGGVVKVKGATIHLN